LNRQARKDLAALHEDLQAEGRPGRISQADVVAFALAFAHQHRSAPARTERPKPPAVRLVSVDGEPLRPRLVAISEGEAAPRARKAMPPPRRPAPAAAPRVVYATMVPPPERGK
jgi:hypothetical protein